MSLTIDSVAQAIGKVHHDLAVLLLDQLRGVPTALNTSDVLETNPIPLRPKTLSFLKRQLRDSRDGDEVERLQRLQFGCTDLMIEEQIASLGDMLRFYMDKGRMIIESDKIPANDVVPWLQSQTDFDKREAMKKENSIFLKGIINPMLLGMLELTIQSVSNLGFQTFNDYSEAKRRVSFDEIAAEFQVYLDRTHDTYFAAMKPWVEEVIGRPFENLGRYHALYLLRIREWDHHFSVSSLLDRIVATFSPLGFNPFTREDITMDLSAKNASGMCIAVQIPAEVYVLMKPVGGIIDLETLLHETGHAFFLCNIDPDLPLEYKRLYRSTALDETFAFLFMSLLENKLWLQRICDLSEVDADKLSHRYKLKRFCLIRRYIGKFLAEKELNAAKDIKNPSYYCERLNASTGFIYEQEGYLLDMEPNFYSLDYVTAWAGANTLTDYLTQEFGETWFSHKAAGDFLKEIAFNGRKYSIDELLTKYCDRKPLLPYFLELDNH